MKVNKKIALIKQRLNKPLPAWDSQKKMAVVKVNKFIRLAFNPPPNAKLAAVAIILFPIDDAPVSDFLIHPYIWYASSKPKTVLNPDEVSDIYTISCNELIHQQTLGTIPKQFKSISYDAPCFQFIQCNCWGATAMILSEFKDCLLET